MLDGIVIVEDLQPLEPLFVHMGVRIGKQKDIPISPLPQILSHLDTFSCDSPNRLQCYIRPSMRGHFRSAPKKWLFAVNREQDHKLFRDSVERFLAAAAAVRSDHSAPLLKFDLDAISASIRDPPNAFLALTHGDVCVDNIFVTAGKGARVRLLDFSSAGLRHSLSDVAAVMLLFPTCWCAGDIPWPFLKRFASMHRHRLAMLADSDEARGTIENDAVYFEELIKMCAYHLVVVISEYWDSAINEDETCGHVPCRHHISARVSSFLRMYEAFSAKARVPIANLHRVIVAFRNDLARTWEGRWPSFPPFPTFASLGSFATVSAVRSAAAREELKRLRHVSRRDVAWAVLNDKRVRVVVWDESFRANDLLSQGVPTLIKGSPTSSWAAMEWNHNASAFASAYGDKQLFAKLLRRTSDVHRSPLGSGYTFRAKAHDLFGSGAAVASQPFYVNQRIDAASTPGIWSKMNLGDKSFCIEDCSDSIAALWGGSEGAVAPLHFDPFHNMFFQFRGVKRFTLFHPSQYDRAYLHPRLHLRHRQAQVNLHDLDLARFPRAANLRSGIQVDVSPGDVLWLPPLWLHQVESLHVDQGASISASVFSPSSVVRKLESAWDVNIPVEPQWNVAQSTAAARSVISGVIDGVYGMGSSAAFIRRLIEERYRPVLYEDAWSPELHVSLTDGGSRDDFAHFFGRSFPKEVADPHATAHAAESDSRMSTCWIAPHCSSRAQRSNYCSSDRDVGGLASSIARIVEIFSDTAVDDAARAIFMDDFIEEIAAAAVGDAEAAVLLRMCFIENNR